MRKPFSMRQGFKNPAPPITVREDAPTEVRVALLRIAKEEGFNDHSHGLRETVCDVLRKPPNDDNWSSDKVLNEVRWHVQHCEWYHVYDIAEALYDQFSRDNTGMALSGSAESFQTKINEELQQNGIGWQMIEGVIQIRGDEGFESNIARANEVLSDAGRPKAANEMHEALLDLSRRPEPDRTGAIHHAMAALECVARDVCGNDKPTLGELLKRYGEKLAFPPPLDLVVEKLWGYTSEYGRHVKEHKAAPSRAQAELVVSLSAALCTFLSSER